MKHLLPVLFLLIATSANAQLFSGELEYRKTFVPKNPKFNVDSLPEKDLGVEMTYLITRGFYQTKYFKGGKHNYSYTYHDNTKRMYDDFADKDYITYRDSRKATFSKGTTRIFRDSIRQVVGHTCFMTETVYEGFTMKTYHATDLSIDPESYKGHEVGDWYNRIKEVNGALSLLTITDFPDYYTIDEVVKITPRKLTAKDFTIDPRKKVVASYDVLDKMVELKPVSLASQDCYRNKLQEAPRSQTKITCYVSLIVSDKGQVSNIAALEKINEAYYKIAVDIVSSCGFEFIPGEIDEKPVSSLTYFPVEF